LAKPQFPVVVKPAFESVDGPCGANVCASCAACVGAIAWPPKVPSVPKGQST
jgi:hypothetical protein